VEEYGGGEEGAVDGVVRIVVEDEVVGGGV
jgi:hypothetical protein